MFLPISKSLKFLRVYLLRHLILCGSFTQSRLVLVSGIPYQVLICIKTEVLVHPLNMLLHVALLVEALPATWNRTNVRLLLAVDSKVRVEFAQTTKDLVAWRCLFVKQFQRHIWKSSMLD